MNVLKCLLIFATVLVLASSIEAKKRHTRKSSDSSKFKTKTKWYSPNNSKNNEDPTSIVASEEHGYYVKRTFAPWSKSGNVVATGLTSPPYLAIPIAWFSCDSDCVKSNSGAISSASSVGAEGFLCDDDCSDPYEPVCGKTASEVAVFYNKCKLNVAKCRTHGLWTELPYDECKKSYANEVEYTDKKFRSSPYFNDGSVTTAAPAEKETDKEVMKAAMEALDEISDKLDEAVTTIETEGSGSDVDTTTISNEVPL